MANEFSMRDVLDFCAGLPLLSFSAGETLIAEGPASNRMFILKSGVIEVLRGETQVAETGDPGAIFGEIATLLGTPHTATVKARTAVSAYRIEDASAFLGAHPEISRHVAGILARRLVDATTYLADFKRQFAHRSDHFAMVDEVMDALAHRQRPAVTAGSGLKSDSRL